MMSSHAHTQVQETSVHTVCKIRKSQKVVGQIDEGFVTLRHDADETSLFYTLCPMYGVHQSAPVHRTIITARVSPSGFFLFHLFFFRPIRACVCVIRIAMMKCFRSWDCGEEEKGPRWTSF